MTSRMSHCTVLNKIPDFLKNGGAGGVQKTQIFDLFYFFKIFFLQNFLFLRWTFIKAIFLFTKKYICSTLTYIFKVKSCFETLIFFFFFFFNEFEAAFLELPI